MLGDISTTSVIESRLLVRGKGLFDSRNDDDDELGFLALPLDWATMRGSSFYSAAAAVCVLGATTALVIPHTIDDIDRHDDQWRPALLDPAVRHRIETPCRSCAFTSSHVAWSDDSEEDYEDDVLEIQAGDRKLELEFSISRDGRRLQLDGEPIFPTQFYRSSVAGGRPIYAVQMPESNDNAYTTVPRSGAHRLPLEVTSFGITVVEPTVSADVRNVVSNDVGRQIEVQVRIVSLEKRVIEADEVVIHLLRTNDDELVIVRMENLSHAPRPSPPPSPSPHMVPPPPPPPPHFSPQSTCAGLPPAACRFRKAIEQKFQALKNGEFGFSRPCAGMRGGSPRQRPSSERHGPPTQQPHFSHREDSHRHHRHHRHHILHSVTRAIIAILIPVMAGIVTGLVVSFVGLLIGRVLGYLWIAITGWRRRRTGSIHRRRCCRRTSMIKALSGADDGEGLADVDEENLPPYEDAPAYEGINAPPPSPPPPPPPSTELDGR